MSVRPSSTARIIAQATLLNARHPDPAVRRLVPPGSVEATWRILAADGSAARTRLLLRLPGIRLAVRLLERAHVPGLFLHFALRKAAIRDGVLAAGLPQWVVFAAGYDTLAWQDGDGSGGCRVELDAPATSVVKQRALPDSGIHFVAADLGEADAAGLLAGCPGFDVARPTAFVAEGLTMYLQAADVDRLFESVRAVAAPGSRFWFTFMEVDEGDHPGPVRFRGQRGRVVRWLRRRGEPFTWGLPPGRVESFAAERGFRLRELRSAGDLHQGYLPGHRGPVAHGEWLAEVEPA